MCSRDGYNADCTAPGSTSTSGMPLWRTYGTCTAREMEMKGTATVPLFSVGVAYLSVVISLTLISQSNARRYGRAPVLQSYFAISSGHHRRVKR